MRKLKPILKLVFSFFLAINLIFVSPLSIYAIDESTLDFFSANGIYFYDPDGEICETASAFLSSNGDNLSIIGDSIIASSTNSLKSTFKNLQDQDIHIINSGKWEEGIELIKNLETIKDIVVFALGTSTPSLTTNQIESVINLIGANQKIVFLTNFDKNQNLENNNQLFKSTASQKQNVIIADWATVIKSKLEFLSDNTKPNENGQSLLAETIYNAINKTASSLGIGKGKFSNNKTARGTEILSQKDLELVRTNRPIYQKIAQKYQLPWEILAAIHYAEPETPFSRSNPKNLQGIYQLYTYTDGGKNEKAFKPAGPVSDQEFERQTDIAANFLKNKIGSNKLKTDADIKRALFYYNGKAQAYINQARDLGFSEEEANNGEGSAYVMNYADDKRWPEDKNINYGSYTYDGSPLIKPAQYRKMGTFLVFSVLRGTDNYNSSCSGPIQEGGLTEEQAIKFVQQYGVFDGASLLGAGLWFMKDCSGVDKNDPTNPNKSIGGSNCVTFSAFFLKKFTKYIPPNYSFGNGIDVAPKLEDNIKDITVSKKPTPWSIFSQKSNSNFGHTGVVLGIHGDKIIFAQAECFTNRTLGKGDGRNTGTAIIEVKSLSEFMKKDTNETKFAHLPKVNTAAIQDFINFGR